MSESIAIIGGDAAGMSAASYIARRHGDDASVAANRALATRPVMSR